MTETTVLGPTRINHSSESGLNVTPLKPESNISSNVSRDGLEALIRIFNDLPDVLDRGSASYDELLDWEQKLKTEVRGTPLEGAIDNGLLVILPIFDYLEFEKQSRRGLATSESLPKRVLVETAKMLREVSEYIATLRSDHRSLELVQLQIAVLESSLRELHITGYDQRIVNGLRGTIATIIAGQEAEYTVCWPDVDDDLDNDIDVVFQDSNGNTIGISVQCLAEEGILFCSERDLSSQPERIREMFDRIVVLKIPGPQSRFDYWETVRLQNKRVVSGVLPTDELKKKIAEELAGRL